MPRYLPRLASAVVLAGLCTSLDIVRQPPAANAAVRICHGSVSSGVKEAGTEAEAHRLALTAWTEIAKSYGEAFTRWELANNRRLACSRMSTGGFRCLATGGPCGISQVPPDPRLLKKRPSPGIDV